jgi:hypothetical protein
MPPLSQVNTLSRDNVADLRRRRDVAWAGPEMRESNGTFLNPWQEVPDWLQSRTFPAPVWDHAAPISPIRDRDLKEMREMFDRSDMGDLEADVNHLLGMLCPEPAWEETGWATMLEFL